jgi:uncharacterized membrane protein
VALSAGVLTLVNLLSIELAALVVLYYAGYRPEGFFRERGARLATLKRVGALVVAIAVLSLFLGGVTYDAYQQAQTRDEVETAVGDALAADYPSVEPLEYRHEYEPELLVFQRPTGVVVTVGVPPGTDTDGLVARLDAAVDAAVGHDVAVEVRFVTVEHAAALGASDGPTAPPATGTVGDPAAVPVAQTVA